MDEIIINQCKTLYDEFIEEMKSAGFRKIFSHIEEYEHNVSLSEDDKIITVSSNDCEMISIKGMRESLIRGKSKSRPYYITMKVYDYNNEEAKCDDTVQFAITEIKKPGLLSLSKNINRVIYYRYPYEVISALPGLRFKKGITITADKILEIGIMRNNIPLKIGKFELLMECDKWFKSEESTNGNV